MATLKDFILKLAKDAGIPETNADLTAIVNSEGIEKIEVQPTIENLIRGSLMNIEAAKNNVKLAEHFKAQTLNGIDSTINSIAQEFEFADSDLADISTTDKTGKRLAILKDKIKATYEKKGVGKKDKEEIEKERKELNDKIKALEVQIEEVKKSEAAKFSNDLKDINLNAYLSTKKYIFPEDVPAEVAIETAKNLVNRKLSEKGLKIVYDSNKKQNALFTNSDQLPYENNTLISTGDFIDSVLAEGKLLSVNGGNGSQPQPQPQLPQPQPAGGNASMTEMMQMQLNALK